MNLCVYCVRIYLLTAKNNGIGGIMEELGSVKLTKEQLAELLPEEVQEYKFVRRKTFRQAIKYFICAASAGAIQLISFSILQLFIKGDDMMWFMIDMPVKDFVSTTIALCLSILWNFTMNRKFTFKSAGNVPRAMALAFLFYVPFYPFQTWYVPTIKNLLIDSMGVELEFLASLVAEGTVMIINCVLEFMWQKLVIYRKEEGSAEHHEVGKIGPNGEIAVAPPTFSGLELYDMLHEGVDIVNTDDKSLRKWLNAKK